MDAEVFEAMKSHLFVYSLSSSSSYLKTKHILEASISSFNQTSLVSHEHCKSLEDLCAKLKVSYSCCHYEDRDRLKEYVKQLSPSHFLTPNGRLVRLIANLSQQHSNAPYTLQSASIMCFKNKWYDHLKQSDLPFLDYFIPKSIEDIFSSSFSGPVVMKPTFSTGSANTFFFETKTQLADSLKAGKLFCDFDKSYLSKDSFKKIQNSSHPIFDKFLVCPYVDGKQFGCEAVVSDGKVKVAFCGEILTKKASIFSWAHKGHVQNDEVIESCRKLILTLDVKYGFFTPDFIYCEKTQQWICIDINPNIGGEGISELMEKLGIKYLEKSFKSWLGHDLSFQTPSLLGVCWSNSNFKNDTSFNIETFPSEEEAEQFIGKRINV